MRVVAAGATGAIGKQLVPRLTAAGHEVHGMTRSESKRAMLELRFPLAGGGVWSFIHVAGAAEATAAAVGHGGQGACDVAVDDPARRREVATGGGTGTGAEQPVPAPRPAAGEVAAEPMTEIRGAPNAKAEAKREFGWQQRHRSWRTGVAP